jgi:hypothetical protein
LNGSIPVTVSVRVRLTDDRSEDADSDGIIESFEEDTLGTSDLMRDSDGDGMEDSYEIGLGRFSLVLGASTWDLAKDDAEARGGYLATFETEHEWDFAVKSLGETPFAGFSGVWIGAVKDDESGEWGWLDGEIMAFNRWFNNKPGSDDRVKMAGDRANTVDSGFWVTRPGNTNANGYVLEVGYSTDPAKADTDGDGIDDREEVDSGTNPLIPDVFFEGDEDRDGWKKTSGINGFVPESTSSLSSIPSPSVSALAGSVE